LKYQLRAGPSESSYALPEFQGQLLDLSSNTFNVKEAMSTAGCTEVKPVIQSAVILYRLLPKLKKTGYNTRAHNFVLPHKNNSNFLPRMLYIDIY